MNWKDISSYSKPDTAREINAVEARFGVFRAVVTRHKDYPGEWVLRCEPFADTLRLKSNTVASAVVEATGLIGAQLEAAIAVLRK